MGRVILLWGRGRIDFIDLRLFWQPKMSSGAASSSSPYAPPEPPKSQKCIDLNSEPYELHYAVFSKNLDAVRELLQDAKDAVNAVDKHGMSVSVCVCCVVLCCVCVCVYYEHENNLFTLV